VKAICLNIAKDLYMAEELSSLALEATNLYDEYGLEDLPESLRRNSLHYYYLSVYPSLKEMRDLSDDEQPPYPDVIKSAYVHTPFCTGVCDFCSYFLTTVDIDDRTPIEHYYESVKQEVKYHQERTDLELSYLFFGGGTPSLIPPRTIESFFDFLHDRGAVSPDAIGTIELHPEFFSDPNRAQTFLDILKANGITRVSVGFQSSDTNILEETNRRHGTDFLAEAMDFLRQNGMIVNLDLMYGLTDLTLKGWERTLHDAVVAQPDSISTYFLFVTPGTVTRSEVRRGMITLPSHREVQTQHIMSQRFLAANGYLESPSDFHAKTTDDPAGFTQDSLPSDSLSLPIGAGGYGYYGRTQFYNVFNHNEYAQRMNAGQSPIWRGRTLSNSELMHRDVMFSFKNAPYINNGLFVERYGKSPVDAFERIFTKLVEHSLIDVSDEKVALTTIGKLCVEEICALFRDPSITEEQLADTPVMLNRKRKLAKYNFFPTYPALEQ
jgi:coproporphyrinogen III oxidase-like Fe-S oxidoreductase